MSELESSDRRAARRAEREQRNVSSRQQQQPKGAAQPEEKKRRSNFISESYAELKKVEWPGQNQVIQGTVVVLVACFVVGLFLYVNDTVWKHVVSKFLLGQ
jgi:preprotein translocase SecE subunit